MFIDTLTERKPATMHFSKPHPTPSDATFRLAVVACGVMASASCLADAPKVAPAKTDLTAAVVLHTVECPNPRRELCVIKKPVGSGYRLLTQGITLEDSGEYWLVDFTKQPKGKQPDLATTSFRVLGKDSDIHEIEISFAARNGAGVKPATSRPAAGTAKAKTPKTTNTTNTKAAAE